MRSRLCFFCIRAFRAACECTWKYRSISSNSPARSARNQGYDKRGEIWMSLISTCGSIHEGHEWFSDYSRGRQEIFMCLAVLLCEQFCRFANGGAKISIKSVLLHEITFFCLSVFSSSEVLGKNYFHSE